MHIISSKPLSLSDLKTLFLKVQKLSFHRSDTKNSRVSGVFRSKNQQRLQSLFMELTLALVLCVM